MHLAVLQSSSAVVVTSCLSTSISLTTMPRYAPDEDSNEDRYYEADLDRQRINVVAWVAGGVPMNKKQWEWQEGRRAAEAAAASQRKATQSSDPEPPEYGGHSSSVGHTSS